jgi:hypothetical protein
VWEIPPKLKRETLIEIKGLTTEPTFMSACSYWFLLHSCINKVHISWSFIISLWSIEATNEICKPERK